MRRALALLALTAFGCGKSALPPTSPELPRFEEGLIAPYDSVACAPGDGGAPRTTCNHHGSSVAELPDGTIAVSWFQGLAEKSPDSRILWSRRAPDAGWSTPEILYDDPALSEGNSALWVNDKTGELYLFFVNIVGNGWSQARMRLIRSTDAGKHWSTPVTLFDQDCWMLRYPPVRLKNGELLLPAYAECLASPVFLRSKDDFATWTVEERWKDGSWLLDHVGAIQPSVVRLANDDVSAICRDGTPMHRITRMTAGPDARTFTRSEPLPLPNPGAAAAQVRLANGHVVIVFDNSPTARAPLAAALSLDDGRTFTAIRTLVSADCTDDECSYPAVVQAKDGSLWVSYTRNRRTIGWVHFNEAWLEAGGEVADLRCLNDEACREGQCFHACASSADCAGVAGCVDGACRSSCETAACPSGETCGPSKLCVPKLRVKCQ